MNRLLSKYIFCPTYAYLRGLKTYKYLRELEKTQWYTYENLKELQWGKLKSLLDHAYKNVPYYRNVFDRLNITPSEIKTPEDFSRLPLLTKDDIRSNFKDMIAIRNHSKLIKHQTTGSTGEPLTFYTDKQKEASHWASKLRARKWCGIDIGSKEAKFWSDYSAHENFRQPIWIRIIRDKLMNSLLLSAFDLSEENLFRYVTILRRFQPDFLFGYASALYIFAQFLKDQKVEPRSLGFKVVISSSETLYNHQRSLMKSVFDCPIINEYGAKDGGFIAQECLKGGMHISMEHVYIEYIDLKSKAPISREKNGEIGEIVVTNLDGFGMPFIRYRLGDVGRLSNKRCNCGLNLPLIEHVEGRVNDMLVTTTGKPISWVFIDNIFEPWKDVKQFRVVQESKNELKIEIVKDNNFDMKKIKYLENKIKEYMGSDIRTHIEFVNNIPTEKSGKRKWFISKIYSSNL